MTPGGDFGATPGDPNEESLMINGKVIYEMFQGSQDEVSMKFDLEIDQ